MTVKEAKLIAKSARVVSESLRTVAGRTRRWTVLTGGINVSEMAMDASRTIDSLIDVIEALED